ncbi:MAG: redoxin domain-containing protein [Planctomycetales bacterium]|nr:redoxin domain-containing protein [Planctomycetales bacterium]
MSNTANSTLWTFLALTGFALAGNSAAAPPPSPEVALGISPLHDVEYTTPDREEIAKCRVEVEKVGEASSLVVLAPDGQLLRRFSDTNSDKQVDVWCYFKDGLEVYRDIDSDHDRKADQHRWFNTGGSRWAIDSNEDDSIDSWRSISPQEVAEEVVNALRDNDPAAFERVLLTRAELESLQLEPVMRSQFLSKISAAPSKFRELAASQKQLGKGSRYVDFASSRPGALPGVLGRESPEVLIYEGATALVRTAGGAKLISTEASTEQVQIGALVRLGDSWKVIEAPQLGGDGVEYSSVFALPKYSGAGATSAAPPTEEMQDLMAELEKLDARMTSASAAERAQLVPTRERQLLELVKATADPVMREQWYTQLADMYSASTMEGHYKDGIKRLGELEEALVKQKASTDVIAHTRYQRLWCQWVLSNQDSKQDFAKTQENWIKQLRAFVKSYPSSPDTAEAYLQLGMTLEFAGETDEAREWYEKLASEFSGTSKGEKGKGAVRRLDSVGKPLDLAGPTLRGGNLDLSKLRGKNVLVQYWATWYEPSKTDMAVINQLYSKYAKRGLVVLGVNLDNDVAQAKAFVAENRYPWDHLYDTDGLEGRLANEMGVMTLPLMMLVDDKGRVVNRNLHIAELEAELKTLLK